MSGGPPPIGWPGETNKAVNEMFDCRLAADRDGQHGISANLLELLAIMARARGAITARPMMAGHNMAAAEIRLRPWLQLRPPSPEQVSLALLEALAYFRL